MNDITNDFSRLDAQCAESRFAQFSTEEHAEYCAWLDQVAMARDSAGDVVSECVDGSGTSNH